jgi:uncharacterized protein with FMN-binding domain
VAEDHSAPDLCRTITNTDVNMWKTIANYSLVLIVSLTITAVCVSPLLVGIAINAEIKAWEEANEEQAGRFMARVTSVCGDGYYISSYKVEAGQLEVSCEPEGN